MKYRIEILDKASKELKQIAKEMGILGTKTKKTKPSLDKMAKSLMKFAKGGVITAAVIAGVRVMHRTFTNLTNIYETQRLAEIKLESALIATGGAVGISKRELTKYAAEMSKLTGIADETIIGAQALMTTFTKVGKDVFPAAIKSAADMSVMFGQDLQQSVIQLGTALNDPIAGVGRLKRIGISFSLEQKNMIQGFVDQNRIMDAQKVILDELNAEFGGVVELMGKDGITTISKLSNSFGDLKEQMGRGLVNSFQSTGTWLTAIIEKMTEAAKATNDYRDALAKIGDGGGTIQDELTVALKEMERLRELKESASGAQNQSFNYGRGDDSSSIIDDEIKKISLRIQALKQTINGQEQIASASTEAARSKAEEDKKIADINKKYVDQWQNILKIQEGMRSPLEKEADALLEQISKIQLAWGEGSKYEEARVELLKTLNGEYSGIIAQIKNQAEDYSDILSGLDDPFLSDSDRSDLSNITDPLSVPESPAISSMGSSLMMLADVIMTIVSMSEDYQEIVKTVTEGLGKLVTQALEPIFEVLNKLIKPVFQVLGNIVQSLNPVIMVIADIFNVLGDYLLAVLPPLGMMIELMGNQLAPILRLLVPIISIFASIMEIISPILEGFGIIMDVITRPIQYVGDLLAWLGSWLAYLGKAVAAATYNITHPFSRKRSAGDKPGGFSSDAFTRALIDFSDYTSDTDWANGSTDTDGGVGASYTAGREITVNVQINTEVIAGDAGMRDLSLMIRDEIYAAEALGY